MLNSNKKMILKSKNSNKKLNIPHHLDDKGYSNPNEANLSNPIIFKARNFQFYGSIIDKFRNTILFNEKNDESHMKTRSGLYEWLYTKKQTAPSPPPPPPPPQTFLARFWKAIQWEGIIMTKEVISSSSASIISVFLTQPLDVLKIHYLAMAQNKKRKFFSNGLIYYEIRKLYKSHGISGFYKGHMTTQRESLFHTVSMFYTHQRVHQKLQEGGLGNYPNLCSFISGFLSATFAVVALKPLSEHRDERLRKKMLLQRYGPIQAAYEIRQPECCIKLYRGCFPEFMYLGTQYGSRFWLYNEIRDFILNCRVEIKHIERPALDPKADLDYYRLEPHKHLTYSESMLAGGASGILGDLVSHPLEVVSSRLHMRSLQRQHFRYEDTCRHYFQCMWLLWKKSSIKGLYAGLTPTLIKSMVCVGFQFTVYDKMEEWLDSIFETFLG